MFEWIKKLFIKKEEPQVEEDAHLTTKPCKTCGKPITYDPSWKHIPNYCAECKAKYREDNVVKIMRRKCRACGKTFTFPSTVKHYPNYCRDCQRKFKERKANG